MQIAELITQFKLFNITLSMIKFNKQNLLEKFYRKVGSGGKDTVNPFLTTMYYKVSFLAWFNFMVRHKRELLSNRQKFKGL